MVERFCFIGRMLLLVALAVLVPEICGAVSPCLAKTAQDSHYWKLGVGSYGAGAGQLDNWSSYTDLDRARMDWVYLTFGNSPNPSRETTEMLNRFLRINPNLKIMVRVWPINNLGWKENGYKATFLDYLYKPRVKERVLQNITSQIHSVTDYIEKPENVVGFTFLEELPFHFSDNGLSVFNQNDLPWGVKRYREQIEAELGAGFKWDARARRWWGQKFAEVLNEINAHIKKESGDKWVFVYLQTNNDTLDWLGEDKNIVRKGVMPLYWREVIKPGVADGFFAYPNGRYIWDRYLKLARDNNWLFFSQLPDWGAMRLAGWQESIRLAETSVPQNLGYFFYVSSHARPVYWNSDPAVGQGEVISRATIRPRGRRYLAGRDIGMDIVKRNLQPELQLEYDFTQPNNEVYCVKAFIRNTRDESWFVNPAEAVLRNVKVVLSLPPSLKIDPKYAPPAAITIDSIGPGEAKLIYWWLSGSNVQVSKEMPIRMTVQADGVKTTGSWTAMSSVVEGQAVKDICQSGEFWYYPVLGSRNIKGTTVKLECLDGQLTMPSLRIESNKMIFLGTLLKGQTLVIGPGRKCMLVDKDSPEGHDVTNMLGGSELIIKPYTPHRIVYSDMDLPSALTKARVTILLE